MPSSETEEYVGRGLPRLRAAMIYRAGKPWSVWLDDFDLVVWHEDEALRCSLVQAWRIVLKRLQWQRANAEGGGCPMDMGACEIWHRHRA